MRRWSGRWERSQRRDGQRDRYRESFPQCRETMSSHAEERERERATEREMGGNSRFQEDSMSTLRKRPCPFWVSPGRWATAVSTGYRGAKRRERQQACEDGGSFVLMCNGKLWAGPLSELSTSSGHREMGWACWHCPLNDDEYRTEKRKISGDVVLQL